MNDSCHRARGFSKSGLRLALCGAVLLGLLAVPAQALVVIYDLGWGYSSTADTDLANYALQEGSIVQFVMYNIPDDEPGPGAIDNFDIYGTYTGDDLVAQPYTDTESPPDHVPGDNTAYNPLTAPDGHVIAYTTQIGPAIGGNDNGYNWYNIYGSFVILGTYDRMYVRVFGATDLPAMEVVASYWGLSSVYTVVPILDTWFTPFIDDVTATNHLNYFEVIPEPGTLSLLALGAAGLVWGRRRRSKSAPGA